MDCPACGTETIVFEVPRAYRSHAPDGTSSAALCPACLSLTPVEADAVDVPSAADEEFARIIEAFPAGGAGAAMALGVGLLVDSLALNRDAIKALFEAVSDAGHDPWLVLERLAAAGTVEPEANLAKLRHQLEQLWK